MCAIHGWVQSVDQWPHMQESYAHAKYATIKLLTTDNELLSFTCFVTLRYEFLCSKHLFLVFCVFQFPLFGNYTPIIFLRFFPFLCFRFLCSEHAPNMLLSSPSTPGSVRLNLSAVPFQRNNSIFLSQQISISISIGHFSS